MSFDSLLTETITIQSVTHSRDSAGGPVMTYTDKYTDVSCRHEEFTDSVMPPPEIGGAPTLIHCHRFYMRDPGDVVTGDIVIDEEGKQLRVTDTDTRRAIGGMQAFRVVVAREVQGQ